jgi:hypothetical protein
MCNFWDLKKRIIFSRRQISSGVDTTMEDDVFDGLRESSGNIGHPPLTGNILNFFSTLTD